MLREFCSSRNNCLVVTLKILLGILFAAVSLGFLTGLGWVLCNYVYILFMKNMKEACSIGWSCGFVSALAYCAVGGLSFCLILIGLAIPPTVIVGIYFITKRIIRECNAANRRAQGFEEVENL
jgi:hypothetical protein